MAGVRKKTPEAKPFTFGKGSRIGVAEIEACERAHWHETALVPIPSDPPRLRKGRGGRRLVVSEIECQERQQQLERVEHGGVCETRTEAWMCRVSLAPRPAAQIPSRAQFAGTSRGRSALFKRPREPVQLNSPWGPWTRGDVPVESDPIGTQRLQWTDRERWVLNEAFGSNWPLWADLSWDGRLATSPGDLMTLEHLNLGASHSRGNAPKAQYDKKSRNRRAPAAMEQRPAPEQRWLFRAVPFEGESLSSIVERSAFQNGVTTRHFLSHLGFPDERRDLDRVSDDQLLQLGALMGYAAGRLQGTTLTNLVLRTLTEVREKGAAEWCIGSGPYIRRPDAVCPQCIATDQVRYRRLQWRLGYVSSCQIHSRALIDCCPNCEHTIVPEDSDIGSWGGGADSDTPGATGHLGAERFGCSRCGADLLQQEAILESAVAADDLSNAWAPLQQALIAEGRPDGDGRNDDLRDTPWGASDLAADLGCPFGFQFVAGVRAVLAILHAPRVGKQLREQLAPLAGCEPQDLCGDGIRGQPPEAYSAAQRRHALNAVGFLVRDGLDSMISKLRSAGITPSALLQIDRYVPYWLAMPIRRELSTGRYSMSPEEIAAARELIVRKARALAAQGGPKGAGTAGQDVAVLEIAVTKAALGRLIGTRDSMAMDEAFGRFRRRYDRSQAMAFFVASFQALPTVPAARTQREATLRTLLIMLVAAVTGDRAETICRVGGSQLACTLELAPAGLRRLAVRAIQESSAGTARALFASRFGNELKGASTRLAASALLSRYGDPAVWNSINALQGVF